MTLTVAQPRVTHPVVRIPVSEDRGMYFVGDMSFDEGDRDLAYIDKQIATWQTWRRYVEDVGEARP